LKLGEALLQIVHRQLRLLPEHKQPGQIFEGGASRLWAGCGHDVWINTGAATGKGRTFLHAQPWPKLEFRLASAPAGLSDAWVKSARAFVVVLVTAPSRTIARKLARAALTQRLVACANLVPAVESHYWWQGKLESANEVLLVLKTARAKLPALETLLLRQHPYDTPEILALPLHAGHARYLAWLADSLRPARRSRAGA
jgi:periplasmic divalent cation tolerance protein